MVGTRCIDNVGGVVTLRVNTRHVNMGGYMCVRAYV